MKIENGYNSYVENINVSLGSERLIVSVTINIIAGLAIMLALKSLGIPTLAASFIALVSAGTGVLLLTKRLPVELVGICKRKPVLSGLWLVAAVVSVLLTARLSVFMYDPALSQYSLFPGDPWLVEHCCLTAYHDGAILAGSGEKNIYDINNYLDHTNHQSYEAAPFKKIGSFKVDLYHYPPQFLLLPFMAGAVTGGDFLNLRMLWFALSVLSLMTAIGFIIYRLESEGRLRMLGMAPLILCSMPVLTGLQMSNVQIIVVSISIIAMALFPLNKPGGGILLAMSTVAKIFPGILIVYLLAQRKFREVLWVVGFAVVLTVIAFMVVGPNPFLAFINYELPRLSSGEAFARPFSREFAIARNMAPFGIPLKLGGLGLPGMTFEIGRIVSLVHLLMVLILAVWAGRQKPRSNIESISVWISLISLGTLVSPFAPVNYVLVSLVLLVGLNYRLFNLWITMIILFIISAPFFISREADFLLQVLCFLPAQASAIAIPGFILYRAGLSKVPEREELLQTTFSTEVSANKYK